MERNPFVYSFDNKRYHTFDYEMKKIFGRKTVKIPLDAGFTCPNLDGSKGKGGCAYCGNGSGDFAGKGITLAEQFENGKNRFLTNGPLLNIWHIFRRIAIRMRLFRVCVLCLKKPLPFLRCKGFVLLPAPIFCRRMS